MTIIFHPVSEMRPQMCVNTSTFQIMLFLLGDRETGQEYKSVVMSPGLKAVRSLCARVLVSHVKLLIPPQTSASSYGQEEINWPFQK